MSTEGVGQATQSIGEQTAASEVAQFFNMVAGMGTLPRLRHVTGACQFDITGAGTWRVAVKDGVPFVTQGTQGTQGAPPDAVFTCSAEDFMRIVRREGYMNLNTALLQGLLTVTGDLGFAGSLLGGVTFEQLGKAATT